MGEKLVMTIVEVLSNMKEADENSAIFAIEPWTWGSEAKLVVLDDGYKIPLEFIENNPDYKLLLDVNDVNDLVRFTAAKSMSQNAVAEFIIHYAIYDAYPAWFSDLPDK
jgi:hypothetical protein